MSKNKNRCVVRLKTSEWSDDTGIYRKQSLTILKRKCEGFNILEEDVAAVGAPQIWPLITNLHGLSDGIYELTIVNEYRDWETGNIEDYEYSLVDMDEVELKG